jgi:hypothetical protein
MKFINEMKIHKRNEKNKLYWNKVMEETNDLINKAASTTDYTDEQRFPLIDIADQWCQNMSWHSSKEKRLTNCFGCDIKNKLKV